MQVSTDARCVVQGVPGFVPRVLRDAEVGLFRAEDRVFDAMLDGWKAQMLADLVDREYAAGSKRWLPALRDSIAFKVCYAYGLRRREVTMLDLHDFGPNPHVPAYGEFGVVTIRVGKRNRRIGAPTPHRADGSRVRVGRGPPQVLDP
jgi:hypothetical protein